MLMLMLIPAPNADWLTFLQAVMVLPIIAMAGGFPCCCERVASSTQPTSTSTSEPPLPPQPPLPPGSTSTSTSVPPLPPKRSSSVGAIYRFECSGCHASEPLLADQWQIEIVGVTGGDCPCAGVDGAYILDGVSDGAYNDGEDLGCGVEFILSGADTGGDPLICPDTYLSLWFLAAGWRKKTFYTPDRFFPLTKVIANLRAISGPPYIYSLHFHRWWDGNPDISQASGYNEDQAGEVLCSSVLPGTVLDYLTVSSLGPGAGFGRCSATGTATIYEVEGF